MIYSDYFQVKAEQVGTEVERANDLIRSALRCVVAISRVDDVEVGRPAPPTRVHGGGRWGGVGKPHLPLLRTYVEGFLNIPLRCHFICLFFTPSLVIARNLLSTRSRAIYFLFRKIPHILVGFVVLFWSEIVLDCFSDTFMLCRSYVLFLG